MDPVILNVEVLYPNGASSIAPGETAELVVDAVDADNYSIAITVRVRNPRPDGGEALQSAAVVVADGLAFTAAAVVPDGVPAATVVQHPTDRNRFFITAG